MAPASQKACTIVYGSENRSTPVTGTENGYFLTHDSQLSAGRRFLEGEVRSGRAACVIGETVRDKLFPAYNLSAVGMTATYALLGVPTTGTHKLANGGDTRVIDQIWFTQATGVTPTAQNILMDYASDPRPVTVDFTLTK